MTSDNTKKKEKNVEDAGSFYASATNVCEVPSLQTSKGNLVYPSSEDEMYDPFSHRSTTVQYSDFGAWAHMVKGGMGTGIMAMPMAFKYGGIILGLVGTPLVGVIAGHCVLLLVSTAQRLYVRARVPAMTMDEVAFYAFKYGPPRLRAWATVGQAFVRLALFLTYFFTVTSYSIFIGKAVQQLVEEWSSQTVMLDTRIYIAVLAIPLVPLCQLRTMRTMVPCSVLANACIIVGFAITLYYLLDTAPNMDKVDLGPTMIGVPIFFSTALYSMEGIGTVMPVENSMRNPGRLGGWTGIAVRAMVFVVVIFTTIGLLGYLRFGFDVHGSVTLDLDSSLWPAQVVKALLAAAITFTFPLQFFVFYEMIGTALQARVSSPKLKILAQIGMRVTLTTLALLMAIVVPNLELVIALMGAVLFASVGLLIPAAVHLVLELAILSETKVGRTRGILTVIKDAMLVTLSLLITCAGVYSALDQNSEDSNHKS